jgi:hypothetical protein
MERTMMDKPKGETKDATLPQTQGEKEKPGKPGQGSKRQNKGDRP